MTISKITTGTALGHTGPAVSRIGLAAQMALLDSER